MRPQNGPGHEAKMDQDEQARPNSSEHHVYGFRKGAFGETLSGHFEGGLSGGSTIHVDDRA